MSAQELPFDLDDMIARLRPWIETESPTFDAAAVNRMVDAAAYDFAAAGASVEYIPGRMGFGGSLRAVSHMRIRGKPGILVSGHLDTVHPSVSSTSIPSAARMAGFTDRAFRI